MTNQPPEHYASKPRGMLPNSRFPLLVYRGAVPGGVEAVRDLFRANGWLNNWRYPGIYTYPHFHSTTHECLGCAQGCRVKPRWGNSLSEFETPKTT